MNYMVSRNSSVFRRVALVAACCLVQTASRLLADDSGATPGVTNQASNVAATPGPSGKRGTWVWSKKSWLEPADRATLFDFLKRHDISVMLVQVHTDYSGETAQLKYREQLAALLREAAQNHVIVHALDGDPSYIYAPWPEKLDSQIRAISDFNAGQPANARFAGVHYDIEPYLLDAYRKGGDSRLDVCKNYLNTLKSLAKVARAHGLEFSVDIPPWFDHVPFPVDGQESTVLDQVAATVDWFGIMAYRNKVSGSDSILSLSEAEIVAMEKVGKKAWIGVETGENHGGDPSKITFWNRPTVELDRALTEVDSQMASRKGYGGLLIHCYERYRVYLGETSDSKQ